MANNKLHASKIGLDQVSLDMAASSLEEIADLTLDNMINCGSLSTDKKDQVKKNRIGKEKISFQPFFFR